MAGTLRHIINMANSIIGVSILSMPYCFKEAGLVLGIILILFSGFITKKTCMFLIKAAIMSRRRSYELLAFQVFGVTGKLLMELCMILFLVGICISFHVVMGDLAPAIAAKYMIIENSSSLRCTILVGMVLLVVLPLCLLRNIDSLASMSACSIGFYVFLNCIIFYMALPNLLDGSWFAKAKLFHFYSAFRVLPIMTLALSCQSNVFEIYDSIPDPDVIKMKSVVSQAVNICCALYIGVGFLGYVAFVDTDITGNVILKFPISNMTDCITIFFVFSLAISFPLMMFPCRTSIHSLVYKRGIRETTGTDLFENTQVSYDIVGNYMPETRFKGITVTVLILSLVLGILLPNIGKNFFLLLQLLMAHP
ncbi:putative sodium-coupled neutral amino acid transporter 10 [Armadillidium nasatum]|uniref:Putative sodium-coupled neutral amino acid transporter 10 n=1 Tax=Armadillidium nasatum TaxID=96803 RepID=A0A5N5TBY6_9CRUS|nr:putative sodium-coupled neutral amino acid transporter 10 [Armadillidium nasatum]